MNYEKYTHDAFLDTLSPSMRIDVGKFIHNGETSDQLGRELARNEDLREYIDLKLTEELEKFGWKKNTSKGK